MKVWLGLSMLFLLVTPLQRASKGPLSVYLFTHGTVGSLGMVSPSKLVGVIKDRLQGSAFESDTAQLRNSNWFSKNQVMSSLGLWEIDLKSCDLSSNEFERQDADCQGAFAIAQAFNQFYELAQQAIGSPLQGSVKFYAFGWSGLLSHKGRIKAAFEQYLALQKLIEELNAEGWGPITIYEVAHSHGGNVALHKMQVHYYRQLRNNACTLDDFTLFDSAFNQIAEGFAEAFSPEQQKDRPWIKIQELWLLGTPIQLETASLGRKEVFDTIVNLYSRGDYIQIGDFFSTRGRHSARVLPQCVGDNHMLQCDISLLSFRRHKLKPRRYFPTHKDLWFLSGGRHRLNFIHPLPLVAIIPVIGLLRQDMLRRCGPVMPIHLHLDVASIDDRLELTLKDVDTLRVVAQRSVPLDVLKVNQVKAINVYERIGRFIRTQCSRTVRFMWRLYSMCNL